MQDNVPCRTAFHRGEARKRAALLVLARRWSNRTRRAETLVFAGRACAWLHDADTAIF